MHRIPGSGQRDYNRDNRPDYKVWAARNEGRGTTVGVAWKGENGEISIKLNDFVVLSNADQERFTLKLYPNEEKEGKQQTFDYRQPMPQAQPQQENKEDDNIPF